MWTKLPNLLTFSRIAVIPVLCGLMYMEPPLGNWLAFSLYVYACVTDFFDGYLARTWQQQSALGRFLDPIADKILVAAILLVLADLDTVDGFTMLPAAVILLREILVSGLREYLAQGQVGMPVTKLAKWKTVLQMLALGFLIVGAAGPNFGPVTTLEIGIYGLWMSAILTLITGYDYLRSTLIHVEQEDKRPAAKSQRDAAKPAKSADFVRNVG
jgi:cardiolipin synthase